MSVEITILPEERTGLVAVGTNLVDAARRLGIRVPTECDRKGECDTCAVKIEKGAHLLSSLVEAERLRLSPDRLADGERLACQVRIESPGELRIRLAPATERAETAEETASDIRKEFRDLSLSKKLSTLFELEAVTLFQTLSAISDAPFKVAEKVLDIAADRGKKLHYRERMAKQPSEKKNPAEGGDKQ